MDNIAVERIKTYVAEHIRDQITAVDIAKAAGYSQYYASKIFKDSVGFSPFEYIRRERMLMVNIPLE